VPIVSDVETIDGVQTLASVIAVYPEPGKSMTYLDMINTLVLPFNGITFSTFGMEVVVFPCHRRCEYVAANITISGIMVQLKGDARITVKCKITGPKRTWLKQLHSFAKAQGHG